MNAESSGEKKSVVIYGATSQIGAAVATKLLEKDNYQVVAFARSSTKAEPLRQKGAEIFIGDVTDPRAIFKAIEGRDVFATVNFAAGFNQSADPRSSFAVNVTAEKYILMATEQLHLPRHVFISTIGTLMEGPNAYKDTKLEAEKLVKESLVPEWLILRYANVLGTDLWNKPFKTSQMFGRKFGITFVPSDKNAPFPYLGIETAVNATLNALEARPQQTITVVDGFVNLDKYLEEISKVNNIDYICTLPSALTYNILRGFNWIANRRGGYFPFTPGTIKILASMPWEIENQTMIKELGITPQGFDEVIEAVKSLIRR